MAEDKVREMPGWKEKKIKVEWRVAPLDPSVFGVRIRCGGGVVGLMPGGYAADTGVQAWTMCGDRLHFRREGMCAKT